ncbi:hypothetical protein DL764_001201 [Monosporascus ibericus]|uniref:Uncharacterized protein n=1 Tax=Monosporascus ibericus TaxID=155417 RepID=A0A4Q4TTZ9_9PEZI|nr:hypothetical protein DL764_001201 [Monosporascus ibericus]
MVLTVYIPKELADSGLQGMPKNCSKDFSAIIEYVGDVFLHGSRKQKVDLKRLFGLQGVRHGDDTAAAISAPIWAWQSIQLYSGNSTFYQMSDAIEGVSPNTTVAEFSKHGVGLKEALPNYAKWCTTSYLPSYAQYYQRQCELFFPRQGPYTYASYRGKTAAALNAHIKGWHLYDTKRLMWVNGEFDPW